MSISAASDTQLNKLGGGGGGGGGGASSLFVGYLPMLLSPSNLFLTLT